MSQIHQGLAPQLVAEVSEGGTAKKGGEFDNRGC